MRKLFLAQILLVLALASSGCIQSGKVKVTPTVPAMPTPVSETPSVQPELPVDVPVQTDSNAAVLAAVDYLSMQLGIPAGEISVALVEPLQWINACLGLPAPEEACAEMITDGYRVYLTAGEEKYAVHTNLDGTATRMKALPQKDTPDEVANARQLLAEQLKVDLSEITLVSFTEHTWPDACMGRNEPGLMCAQVITTGYEITFDVFGKQIVCAIAGRNHSFQIISNPFNQNGMRDVLIVLDQKTPECQSAMFSDTEVTTGACGGELVSYPYTNPDFWHQINWLAERFASFDSQTDEYSLRFSGRGGQIASPAEQRSIFEWARIALKTSQIKVSVPDVGVAAVIKQTGGVAGICSRTKIHLDGWAYREDCRTDEVIEQYHLINSELDALYQLYVRLAEVEVTQSLPEDAKDAFNYEFRIIGQGKESLRAEDMDTLIRWLRSL